MRVTDQKYLSEYKNQIDFDLEEKFNSVDFSDVKINLDYRTKVSAVFSSNIEGNPVDLNSFMNSVSFENKSQRSREVQEIEDLVSAYEFAQKNKISEKNFLKAHKLLSKMFLPESKRGVCRNDKMGVFDESGLVYLAVEPEYVSEKMSVFFEDIKTLLKEDLSISELFYHAALIHLVFVHIHPFWDGNGRCARLLEKWFLAQKINSRAWKIQSEKYYKEHISDYYRNINIGVNFYELNYEECVPFLGMLPMALVSEN